MDKEDKKKEMVVSLRGLHMFTHPALMYGVINSIFEPRFLRRNLSYAASRAGAMYRGSGAPGGRTLLVRLGDVQLTGSHLPDLVTLLVVLCEAASTGQDFKPVYAAALTLPASPGSCPPEGDPFSGEEPTAGGAGPARTVVLPLPLPPRQLTRPVLILLASDGHLDLRALAPSGRSARRLRTDLRTGTKLLGLLPDPCAVWAAVQPLSVVFSVAGTAAGSSTASAAAAAGVAGPPPASASLTLQRGLLTRSSCQLAAASGRTLTTTLLNLNRSLSLDPTEVGSLDRPGAQAAGGAGVGGGQLNRREPEGPGRDTGLGPRGEAAMLVESTAAAAPGPSKDDDGSGRRLTQSGGGGRAASVAAAPDVGGVVGCNGELVALERPVGQTGQVKSLAVAMTMEIGEAAQAAGLRPRRRSRDEPSTVPAVPSTVGALQPTQPQPAEDLVVEFRYVFDDPLWSVGAARVGDDPQRQPRRGRQGRGRGRSNTGEGAGKGVKEGPQGPSLTTQPAAGAGARGVPGRAAWMQDQMMSQQVQQVRLVRQLEFGAQEQRVEAAAAAKMGGERKRSLAPATAAAAVGSSRRSAAGGGRARRGGQGGGDAAQPAAAAAAAAAGPSTAATTTERYFVEELRVEAGGAINCPMCPVACRSFRGLQQHLPASHGLYHYSYPTAPQHAPGDLEPGKDPGRPSCLHVVEVRLPPESVDPARGDLVLSYEDELVMMASDGEEGLVEVFRRPWYYSRAAGMTSCKFIDSPPSTPDAAVAGADAGAVQAPPPAAPSQPPPQASSQPPGCGRRGPKAAGDGGERAAAEEGTRALTAPDWVDEVLEQQRKKRRRQQQQQQQQQQQPQPQPQLQPGLQEGPATAAGDAEAAGTSRAGASTAAGAASRGRGSGGGGTTCVVHVPVESLRRTIAASGAAAEPGGGSTAAAGAAGGWGPRLPPIALAAGVHPAGRRYFHSRSAVPASAEEMLGPYDSDDETDDDEWEASLDRHLVHTTRVTPLRPSERRFFKLWSSFARRRPIFADYITPSRCLEFAREYGCLIRAGPELRSALVVHLLMLHEMNLVDPRVIRRCLEIADGRLNPTAEEDERFLATRNATTAGRAAAGGHGRGGGTKGSTAAATASTDDYDYDGDRRPPGGGGSGGGGAAAADGSSADSGGSGDGNESDSSQVDDQGDVNDGDEGRNGGGGGGGGGERRERIVQCGEGEAEGDDRRGAAGHRGEPSDTARAVRARGGGDEAVATVVTAVATAPRGAAAQRPGSDVSITAAVEAAVVEAEAPMVAASVPSRGTSTPRAASTSATAAAAAPLPMPTPITQGANAAAAVGGCAGATEGPQQQLQQSAVRLNPAMTWSLNKKGRSAPLTLPPRPLNNSQPGRRHMCVEAGEGAATTGPVTVTAAVTRDGSGKGARESGCGRVRSAAGEGAEEGQRPATSGGGRASRASMGNETGALAKPSVC